MAVKFLIDFDGIVGWGNGQALIEAEVQPSPQAAEETPGGYWLLLLALRIQTWLSWGATRVRYLYKIHPNTITLTQSYILMHCGWYITWISSLIKGNNATINPIHPNIKTCENQCCYSDMQSLAINIYGRAAWTFFKVTSTEERVLQKKVRHTGLEEHNGK